MSTVLLPKLIVSFKQIAAFVIKAALGFGKTVTMTSSVSSHPLLSTTVSTYLVVCEGLTLGLGIEGFEIEAGSDGKDSQEYET